VKKLWSSLKAWWRSEEGQGMVEYGLIIALVAIALIVTIGLLRGQIAALFDAIRTAITGATPR
jgi:pilus assembly protein Flp/PilA